MSKNAEKKPDWKRIAALAAGSVAGAAVLVIAAMKLGSGSKKGCCSNCTPKCNCSKTGKCNCTKCDCKSCPGKKPCPSCTPKCECATKPGGCKCTNCDCKSCAGKKK